MQKGVILAGGNGTRLRPLTFITNKHLLPVYNKPMVLYPLETLKSLGITDILLISGGDHIGDFTELLGDGSAYGVNVTYKVQKEAGGIAQALSLAEGFVGNEFAVILGDNIFEGKIEMPNYPAIVLKEVEDPQRFGVFDYGTGQIIEKPKEPATNLAVTGLYFYDKRVFNFIKTLEPSARGELEITDVNNYFLRNFRTKKIHFDGFWSDAGTFDSLMRASNHIHELTKAQAS